MTKVLYPGSFDPITKGHMDIIEQASNLFDEVIVAVLQNPIKKTEFFSLEERVQIIKELYKNHPNVKVILGFGATVDVALAHDTKSIIRGIRNLTDYDYEIQLHQMNRDISNNKINTVYLLANKEYQHISSSMVKEVFFLNKDISKYVEPLVKERMLLKNK